jgi:glyoxylase-like metal-dependent hydrolase (beta-lactamase superfamily II)
MDEIASGLWHWSAPHMRIPIEVSSYYLSQPRVLIDPMIPPEGLRWFDEHGRPEHILLSNRHHDRQSWELREAFGCTIQCVSNGLYELEGRGPVHGFEFGDDLPGGVIALEVDAICPDETALYIPSHRALACADGVIRSRDSGRLAFVSDGLMDDPEQTKEKLRSAYRRLLDRDFELLLLAHGEPVLEGGKGKLEAFVS